VREELLIDNPETAKYVSELLLGINGQLDESVAKVEHGCSSDEFKTYRRCVGRLINSVFEGILEPIYVRHPKLKPPDLEM
jgi:hypothetical protein